MRVEPIQYVVLLLLVERRNSIMLAYGVVMHSSSSAPYSVSDGSWMKPCKVRREIRVTRQEIGSVYRDTFSLLYIRKADTVRVPTTYWITCWITYS